MASNRDLGEDLEDGSDAASSLASNPATPGVPGKPKPGDKPADKYSRKTSVPGAIVGGVFNAGMVALILAIPGFNLPFITAGFAALTLPLLAGPVAEATSAFMRLGYINPVLKNLSGMVERSASLWGCWAMYTFYPLALTAIGLPPVVDTVVKTLFGVGAIVNGIGILVNFFSLFRGNKAGLTKRDMKKLERLDKVMKRRKKNQDSFFEDD